MTNNNPEDPKVAALRDGGNASQGELWKRLVPLAGKHARAAGISEEQFVGGIVNQANGVALTTALGVDQALADASAGYGRDGDKDAAAQGNRVWDDYWIQNFPNSRKARAIKERRGG
jgi:hypothetical protein